MKRGLLDPETEDPFSLFVASTTIRYCYYHETHKILGNTFGMCVLQVCEQPAACSCGFRVKAEPFPSSQTLANVHQSRGHVGGCTLFEVGTETQTCLVILRSASLHRAGNQQHL